jgi:hypothetical protein
MRTLPVKATKYKAKKKEPNNISNSGFLGNPMRRNPVIVVKLAIFLFDF